MIQFIPEHQLERLTQAVNADTALRDQLNFDLTKSSWEPLENTLYLQVQQDNQAYGYIGLRMLTPQAVEVHMLIHSNYWGFPISREIGHALKNFSRTRTNFKTWFILAPIKCLHVLQYGRDMHGELTGRIPNGCEYHGEIQDLILITGKL